MSALSIQPAMPSPYTGAQRLSDHDDPARAASREAGAGAGVVAGSGWGSILSLWRGLYTSVLLGFGGFHPPDPPMAILRVAGAFSPLFCWVLGHR